MALVKSGWLWRQSTFLKRWKCHWFDLWLDGTLLYSDDESRRNMSDKIVINTSTIVKAGHDCPDVQPPEGKGHECLITVLQRDGSRLILCAETSDEAIAWKMSLMEAKSNVVCVYDPYDDYYQAVPIDAYHAVYVNQGPCGNHYRAPGTTHWIIREDNFNNTGTQMALGMLAGAVTGTALSSIMWLPCWF
ncbi:pleckstrin homology domain-containing family B member 1 [Ambystoma mexicanum]|uniref:pleckstrin homology domain-containing family B member 1 n=1 Tax=Ambystoma mexicanum TaxID=8296 RepID=UPI0037E8F6D4